VDEFREIWFQNSADPPSFARPRPPEEIEGTEEPRAIEDQPAREGSLQDQGDGEDGAGEEVLEQEAQSEFLKDLVSDKALEEEINRHLGQEEFQQALAEMDGIYSCTTRLTLELRQQVPSIPADGGSLSDLDDDDEVANAIIDDSSEHFLLRAQLWMESNRDYLKEQRGILTPTIHV
jgi:hypothetical protein